MKSRGGAKKTREGRPLMFALNVYGGRHRGVASRQRADAFLPVTRDDNGSFFFSFSFWPAGMAPDKGNTTIMYARHRLRAGATGRLFPVGDARGSSRVLGSGTQGLQKPTPERCRLTRCLTSPFIPSSSLPAIRHRPSLPTGLHPGLPPP